MCGKGVVALFSSGLVGVPWKREPSVTDLGLVGVAAAVPSGFIPPGMLLVPGVLVAVGVFPSAGLVEVIGVPVLLVPRGAMVGSIAMALLTPF